MVEGPPPSSFSVIDCGWMASNGEIHNPPGGAMRIHVRARRVQQVDDSTIQSEAKLVVVSTVHRVGQVLCLSEVVQARWAHFLLNRYFRVYSDPFIFFRSYVAALY